MCVGTTGPRSQFVSLTFGSQGFKRSSAGAAVSFDLQKPPGKTPQVVSVSGGPVVGTPPRGELSPPTTWKSYLTLLTEDLETGRGGPRHEANLKVLGDAVRTRSALLYGSGVSSLRT